MHFQKGRRSRPFTRAAPSAAFPRLQRLLQKAEVSAPLTSGAGDSLVTKDEKKIEGKELVNP